MNIKLFVVIIVGSNAGYSHHVFRPRQIEAINGGPDEVTKHDLKKQALLEDFFERGSLWKSSITVAGNDGKSQELKKLCKENGIGLSFVFHTQSSLRNLLHE